METFQKPLSPEEEIYYVQLLQKGTPTEKREAKQVLIERNLRLVAHIVRKYQNVDEELDDLLSIGAIGLIKAVDSFDRTKGNRLATYAARCIDNELLMKLRSKKKTAREVSLYESIGKDKEGNEIHLLDIIEQEQTDIVESLETERNISKMNELIETRLTDREKEIIAMRYGLYGREEMTQKQIGDTLNISRSYVSRIEKRALQRLRDAFD